MSEIDKKIERLLSEMDTKVEPVFEDNSDNDGDNKPPNVTIVRPIVRRMKKRSAIRYKSIKYDDLVDSFY